MKFQPMDLAGVQRIALERHADERGYFARSRCQREFAEHGLVGTMVQDSISYNAAAHTLRGLHYHAPEFRQVRLVRCIAASAFVAMVDLRPNAPSYLRNVSLVLDAADYEALYIPPGIAMGYQTLGAGTTIFYQMSQYYQPQHERGWRWDDPAFGISWPPAPQRIIKERDAGYPDFDPAVVAEFAAYPC